MIGSLLLALSFAGILLLVLGERLGIPAPQAALGVVGIFAVLITILAILTSTTRLQHFLSGAPNAGIRASAALQTCCLLLVVTIEPSFIRAPLMATCVLATAYLATLLLVPRLRSADEERRFGPDTSDINRVMALCTCGFSCLMFFYFFPLVLALVRDATGWSGADLRLVAIVVVLLPVVLAGLTGLSRVATHLVVVIAFVILLPAGIDVLRSAQAGDVLVWHEQVVAMVRGQHFELPQASVRLALLGMAFALMNRTRFQTIERRFSRYAATLAGLALASLLAGAAYFGFAALDGVITHEISGVSPERWPIFAFDEAIRGWLRVCAIAPQDAIDLVQACRIRGVALPVPASELLMDSGLRAPALAASRGWPVIMGFIWGLSGPILGLIALGFALHTAATGVSELVLFRMLHPFALKAWRLAAARVMMVSGFSALVWLAQMPMRLDDQLMTFLMLSLAFLLITTLLWHWLRLLISWQRRCIARSNDGGPGPTAGQDEPLAHVSAAR